MTYAEQVGEEPFDWNHFLSDEYQATFHYGSLTYYAEWGKVRKLAGDWPTCACGNQCSVLPRNNAGIPKDGELAALGLDFYDCIEEQCYVHARGVLHEIEKRSAFLLSQLDQDHANVR